MRYWVTTVIIFVLVSCKNKTAPTLSIFKEASSTIEIIQKEKKTKKDHDVREVLKASIAPVIDGNAIDSIWSKVPWYPLDQKWTGKDYTKDDFQGRFKLTWTSKALYLFVEITDDVLVDSHENPLENWWDDDCVEIFIDADNSGGDHLYNHNAFAYHVALDGTVVDLGISKKGLLLNDHVETKKITKGNVSFWEHRITLFADHYSETGNNTPLTLHENSKIGFSLAYCDNDGSLERENFIGAVSVPGEDKNQGYKNADTFATLILKNNTF